jgi:hypothetical protein
MGSTAEILKLHIACLPAEGYELIKAVKNGK